MTPNEQTAIIVEAMGMAGPEFSGPSRMRAVASMVERLDRRLQTAIREGKHPLHRLREFRLGLWPKRDALIATVHKVLKEAEAAVAEQQAVTG